MEKNVKVPVLIDLKKYDYNALRQKFVNMKIREVMQEYVMVINELSYLEEHISEPLFSAMPGSSWFLKNVPKYDTMSSNSHPPISWLR